MFFIKDGGSVYHILADHETGDAPEPCGSSLDRYDLAMLRHGRPTPNVVTEMPPEAPLCQHCLKAADGGLRARPH